MSNCDKPVDRDVRSLFWRGLLWGLTCWMGCTTASAESTLASDASGTAVVDRSSATAAGIDPQGVAWREMAERIDRQLEAALAERGWVASPLADDAEFLRRLSLDLTGAIPTVAEVREFLADESPEKRTRWIDRLLDSPRHPTHLAATWRRLMLPQDFDPAQLQQAVGLQDWLRSQFVANLRYDRLVAEFLAASGDERTGPALFYRSLDADPAKLAAATSRIFLGLQIQCAECHDHPFDHWKQRDFWGYAAFFAQLERDELMSREIFRVTDRTVGEVTLPETDEIVPPRFPAPDQPLPETLGTRRRQLAIWMASGDNPLLAPAAVNRVWGQLFGRGLVNPIDDLGPHNPASHPQLLHELAEYFVAQRFDLKQLYRTLANTRAYQRTSAAGDRSAEQLAWLAGMPIKRLTAEQLYDSLQRSLYTRSASEGMPDPLRAQFVSAMESSSRDLTDYDLGMQQALRMMNGAEIARATGNGRQGILAALQAPLWDRAQQVEILFLATLSRPPTAAEADSFANYLASHEGAAERALGDILWALLNSGEYQFNH